MKKRLTRGEKWLFASPLLFLAIAGVLWAWQKAAPLSLKLPDSETVWSMKFSPDGKRLVAFVAARQSDDSTIRVFDLESRSRLRDLSVVPTSSGDIRYLGPSWSPDGESVVANYVDTYGRLRIAIWDADSGMVKADYPLPPSKFIGLGAYSLFSPDGKYLVGGGLHPAVLDAVTGSRVDSTDSASTQDSWSQLSQQVGLWSGDDYKTWRKQKLGLETVRENGGNRFKDVRVWVVDAKTKRTVWKPKLRKLNTFMWENEILAVLDYPNYKWDATKLFNIDEDERNKLKQQARLYLWDGKTRKQLPSPPILPIAGIRDFKFHPDGKSIGYCTYTETWDEGTHPNSSNELVWWDYRENRVRMRIPLREHVSGLQWSPKGKWLIAYGPSINQNRNYSYQFSMWVFDQTGKLRYSRDTQNNTYHWSPDEKQLAIYEYDRKRGGNGESNSRIDIIRFDD